MKLRLEHGPWITEVRFRTSHTLPVGVGAGLDDGAPEGEPVYDRGAESGVGEVLVHPTKDPCDAIATEAFSSRSVGTLEQRFGAAAVELHV